MNQIVNRNNLESRITFRDLVDSDLPFVKELLTNEQVMRFIGPGRPLTEHEIQSWFTDFINRQRSGHSRRVIGLKDGKQEAFIGICGVLNDDGCADFGFYFLPRYWGKGYAFEACSILLPEAIEQFGDKLVIFVSEQNIASLSLVKKLGLVVDKYENYHGRMGYFFKG
ncbi:GNAT family N-acetyltransferase [Algicola sagamiensis]|uniref:GNAT family N-acetyltransferase n=1 Tax=Algicola sagamiensis TaxID=163869 RepID=UPI00037C7BD1|nr:GNAT family N-acetyltransferase [Algicola sagamiensis]